MDARKSRNTRVKTGCLVCRRRRVKCDEVHPMCSGCRRVGAECVYPETRRFCPIEPSRPSSRHQSSHTPAEVSPIPTEASQGANIPPSFAPSNGNGTGTQTQTVEGSLPEIKAYLEYKGYDTNPEQATALACMSALLRKTKMAEYFLGADEPWMLLGDMFDTEFDLQCVSHSINYTLSLLVIDEQNNFWLDMILHILLVKKTTLPGTAEALRLILLELGAAHIAYLRRESNFVSGLEHCRVFTQTRQEALQQLRRMIVCGEENDKPELLAVAVLQLGADMLTLNPSWRETLRITYRLLREQSGPQTIFERFAAGFDVTQTLPLSHLAASMRCVLQALVAFDIYASLSQGSSPILAFEHMDWCMTVGQADETPPLHRICGIDPELSKLLARVTSCVARRRQYQTVYGTLDFAKPSVDAGTFTLVVGAQEHETAMKALITCVKDVTEGLIRWKADYDSQSASSAHTAIHARSKIYWYACRVLLFRHVYRRPANDAECQRDASAILRLCGDMANGKIEYLNWPIIIASSILSSSQVEMRSMATDLFRMFSYQRCFDLFGSRGVVEEMWKRIDQERDYDACFWVEVMYETGPSFLLA